MEILNKIVNLENRTRRSLWITWYYETFTKYGPVGPRHLHKPHNVYDKSLDQLFEKVPSLVEKFTKWPHVVPLRITLSSRSSGYKIILYISLYILTLHHLYSSILSVSLTIVLSFLSLDLTLLLVYDVSPTLRTPTVFRWTKILSLVTVKMIWLLFNFVWYLTTTYLTSTLIPPFFIHNRIKRSSNYYFLTFFNHTTELPFNFGSCPSKVYFMNSYKSLLCLPYSPTLI